MDELDQPYRWGNKEVVAFLETGGMRELVKQFILHHVSGKDFLSLTDKELRKDLAVSDLHLRKKLLRRIGKLKKTNKLNCMSAIN